MYHRPRLLGWAGANISDGMVTRLEISRFCQANSHYRVMLNRRGAVLTVVKVASLRITIKPRGKAGLLKVSEYIVQNVTFTGHCVEESTEKKQSRSLSSTVSHISCMQHVLFKFSLDSDRWKRKIPARFYWWSPIKPQIDLKS